MKKLFLLLGLALGLTLGYLAHRPTSVVVLTTKTEYLVPPLSPKDIVISDLWTEVNEERASLGLPELRLDPQLAKSSKGKCDDMVSQNYWGHTAPNGTEPWNFLRLAGIVKYQKAGENLAYGFSNAQDVVIGWMNSPTHKANIVDPAFTNEGFAVCESPNFIDKGYQLIVVQHFIR